MRGLMPFAIVLTRRLRYGFGHRFGGSDAAPYAPFANAKMKVYGTDRKMKVCSTDRMSPGALRHLRGSASDFEAVCDNYRLQLQGHSRLAFTGALAYCG